MQVFLDLSSEFDMAECSMMYLDLSSAFDTVDHSILLNVLHNTFGVHNNVHNWFNLHLTDHNQVFCTSLSTSDIINAGLSVSQGSLLGQQQFSGYTENSKETIASQTIEHHFYVEMTLSYWQMYIRKNFTLPCTGSNIVSEL